DVRAKVQFGRKQPVTDAVTRKKCDARAPERTQQIRARRLAKRRVDASLLAVGQLVHVVETAAADDADCWERHRSLWTRGSWLPQSFVFRRSLSCNRPRSTDRAQRR